MSATLYLMTIMLTRHWRDKGPVGIITVDSFLSHQGVEAKAW
jgi:hypothetical protein